MEKVSDTTSDRAQRPSCPLAGQWFRECETLCKQWKAEWQAEAHPQAGMKLGM